MAYHDGAFCETLEAIRKRLSDLRAVLDSGCYDQINSIQSNYFTNSLNKHSHKKSYKIKKSRHHHLHHHSCDHHLNAIQSKDISHHKKYCTDKIGRRLYARAIPIEKDYLLNYAEMKRLMKRDKKDKREQKDVTSNKIQKKQKAPILFPFEEINLRKSEMPDSSDYEYNSSDNDYNYYDDNEYLTGNDYAKRNAKNQHSSSSNANKKQIIYLKTYQTQEKSRKSNNDPHIYQEKGKIVYFDGYDESIESEPNQISLNCTDKQYSKKIKVKKDILDNNKLDPIIPILNNHEDDINHNKNIKMKINRSKKEKLNKIDDENLVIQERKIDMNLIQINNFDESRDLLDVKSLKINHIQKESTPNQVNNKIKMNTQTKKEIKSHIKQKNNQNKLTKKVKKINNQTHLSSPIKNKDKYNMNKSFTIKMCIENQPICIAVGDIEGDIKKLRPIYNLIKTNPSLSFVFIGDLIDDLSDACPLAEENWECLSLLSEFFVGKNELSFKTDDNKNIDIISTDSPISLPSAFNEIRFEKKNFDEIQGRVKFIAGNAECDALSDIQQNCNIITGDITKYAFGKGKWKKTLTFEQMCLAYRYFKSCYGIIELKINQPNSKSKSNEFKDTIYFRHAPSTFKDSKNIISQIPDLNENEIQQGNFIFITGHIRKFVSSLSKNPEAQAFIIDTSPRNYGNDKRKEIKNQSENDKRLAIVSFNNKIGFSVEAFALPGEFPK